MNTTKSLRTSHRFWLVGLICLAAVLRLFFILVIDPHHSLGGGDVIWYFENGLALVKNTAPPLQPGPTYLVYVGLIQLVVPPVKALQLVDPMQLQFVTTAFPAIAVVRLLNVAW